jgi:hypothetical protein
MDKKSRKSRANFAVLQWAMTFGFLAGFFLVIVHSYLLLNLGVEITAVAAGSYVFLVICILLLNLWFMAGQPIVLQTLAFFEPTSCIMEWLHDSVFGVSKDRLDEAYTSGSYKHCVGRDGKEFVQLLIPRRLTPYPISIGGLIQFLFFSAEDPFNPDKFVPHVVRTAAIASILVLVAVTSTMEHLYSAHALQARAWRLQDAGDIPGAIAAYQIVLHQRPDIDPATSAVAIAHLPQRHAHAAGTPLPRRHVSTSPTPTS